MPKDETKRGGRGSTLRCCVIAVALTVYGGDYAFAQSTAASNANPNPAAEAQPAGKLVIPPQFDDAWPFAEGLARVRLLEKWGFIDRTGAMVIAPSFDDAESFSAGRAAIQQNGKWGFIDKTGKTVIAPEFQDARSFAEGLAAVRLKGKWGFIDSSGTMRIPATFNGARSFNGHFATVLIPWGLGAVKWHYIDRTGKVAITTVDGERIDYAADFSDGRAMACHSVHCYFIDTTGASRAGPWPMNKARLWGFSEGLARIQVVILRQGYKTGFVDSTGAVVIPHTFGPNSSQSWYDDAVGATSWSDYRVVDRTGMPIELPSLTRKCVFSEGLASAELDGKWGFIDRTGAFVIPAKFSGAYRFSDGLALVTDLTGIPTSTLFKRPTPRIRYGYIDKTGAMVIGPWLIEYDSRKVRLKDVSEGLAPVMIDGKWGYASREP